MLLNIIAFLLAIFILVTIHEFGHFWVARRLGIKVTRFSIGFGRPILRFQAKSGTEFALGYLPLGGYVKLLDESEGEVAAQDLPYAFNRQPLWKRFLVVLAGVVMNLVLAMVLFWLVFTIGLIQPKPIIGSVTPHSISALAGVQPGSEIVNLSDRKVRDWSQVLLVLVEKLGDKGKLYMTVTPAQNGKTQQHFLDINDWQINPLKPDILASLGITPYRPTLPAVIHQVSPNGPAARAGLIAGDRVLAVDGRTVNTWTELVTFIRKAPNKSLRLSIIRDGQIKTVTVNSESRLARNWTKIGYIGVKSIPLKWPVDKRVEIKYSPLAAVLPALATTWVYFRFNAIVIGKLITRKLSLQGLGGPIAIFQMAQQAFKQGVVIYLNFLAILSTLLAFINILPIPGLDGGHLLFYVIEAVRKKPLSPAAQVLAMRLGLIVLIVLIIHATINDLMRLF